MIAMALSCRPRLLIADEPTTALDVTVQAQVLRLLRSLQREYGMGLIFITHDMGVVAEMADRVLVMRDGVKVEEGDAVRVFDAPRASLYAHAAECGAGAGQPRRTRRCRRRFRKRAGALQPQATVRPDLPPVLDVTGLTTRFDVRRRFRLAGADPCGRAGDADGAARRDAGAGGRVGLRQVHHRAQHHPAGAVRGRRDQAERRGRHTARPRARGAAAARCAVCVPGPARLARSAADHRVLRSPNRSARIGCSPVRRWSGACTSCCGWSGCCPSMRDAIRTNCRAGSGSAAASRGHSRRSRV